MNVWRTHLGFHLPPAPKSFEPMQQLRSAHNFLPFSEGRTCSRALLLWKAMVNHAVVLVVSH